MYGRMQYLVHSPITPIEHVVENCHREWVQNEGFGENGPSSAIQTGGLYLVQIGLHPVEGLRGEVNCEIVRPNQTSTIAM